MKLNSPTCLNSTVARSRFPPRTSHSWRSYRRTLYTTPSTAYFTPHQNLFQVKVKGQDCCSPFSEAHGPPTAGPDDVQQLSISQQNLWRKEMLLHINFLLGFQKVLDLFHRQITVLFLLLLDLQGGLELTRTVTCVSFVFWWTERCEVLTLSSICWNLRVQHS